MLSRYASECMSEAELLYLGPERIRKTTHQAKLHRPFYFFRDIITPHRKAKSAFRRDQS